LATVVVERFTQKFDVVMNEMPGDYKAFVEAKLAAKMLQTERWQTGFEMPFGMPCYVCHNVGLSIMSTLKRRRIGCQ